jgi:quercetin dioxygenase-like cupin family protein
MRVATISGVLAVLVIAFQPTQAQDKMVFAAKSTSKFVNFPGLPKCMTGSVQNGDPSKGASVILAKSATGCKVPWHWHTATEQLMMVSGTGKVEMKDGSPSSIHAGDYLRLPGKNVHQFTCTTACTLFIAPDGAFDIHYVDANGKEIPPEDALKSAAAKKASAVKAGKKM